jgi:hypothetical protein
MPPKDNSVVMENVQIIFRNFSGREGQYNRAGDRNFCALLDPENAAQMEHDGWNVKFLKAREEGDTDQAYLPISVNFSGRPPKVVMLSSRGRSTLHEEQVELLDWADLATVDLIVRPYEWDVNGKTGTKAYLQSLFATVMEDALELKYMVDDEVYGELAPPPGVRFNG